MGTWSIFKKEKSRRIWKLCESTLCVFFVFEVPAGTGNEFFDWLLIPLQLPIPFTLFSMDQKRRKRNRKKKLSTPLPTPLPILLFLLTLNRNAPCASDSASDT